MYRHYYIWERGSYLIPALETGLEPCRRLVHMLWSSSGQKWEATVSTCLSFIAMHRIICCHRKLCGSLPPEAAGHLCFPTLRGGLSSRMWIASFSNSSLGVLAWSTTVVSSHLIGWWLSHACFASADFSSAPFWQASRSCLKAGIGELPLSPHFTIIYFSIVPLWRYWN